MTKEVIFGIGLAVFALVMFAVLILNGGLAVDVAVPEPTPGAVG